MAGQPHRTAKRVTDLEARSLQLMLDTAKIAPEHYREKPDEQDALCMAWNDAASQTSIALFALADLGDLVREKAGITEPGPVARHIAEKEKDSEVLALGDGEGI